MRTTYKVLDNECCRKAFKLVFCVGNHMLDRLRRKKNQDVMAERPLGRPKNALYFIVEQWMKDYFEFNCEKLPNKEIIHLPDSLSKWDVWKTFRSTFPSLEKAVQVNYRYWCRIWEKDFPHVKIPNVNRFGVCADCEEFKTIRDKAVTSDDKSKLKKILLHENMF